MMWRTIERIALLSAIFSVVLAASFYVAESDDRRLGRSVALATLDEIREAKRHRIKVSIASAWEVLTRPVTGTAGKKDAIQFLAESGEDIDGISVSCDGLFGIKLEGRTGFAKCPKIIDLAYVSLRDVSLVGADFSGANLSGAKFSNSNLYKSKFVGSDLSVADFSVANLSLSDLSRADLRSANFDGANLTGVDFTDVILRRDRGRDFLTRYFEDAWFWKHGPPIIGLEGVNLLSCTHEHFNSLHVAPPIPLSELDCDLILR